MKNTNYKKIRTGISICLLVGYFILFWSPAGRYVPQHILYNGHRIRISLVYLLVTGVLHSLIALIQNKIARRRGEELPYPDYPFWY